MATLKEICDKFDKHYELEGKKQKEVVTKLKVAIEEKWIAAKADMEASGMSWIELEWLVWMYGKVRYVTDEENEEIIGHYKHIVDLYDTRSKQITDEKHFTTMFQVITYDLKAKPCMEK
jgi:hypothetical protein